MLKYTIIILLLLIAPASADELDDVIAFLDDDQTDTHEYLPWYTYGHYSRDLARNACEHNLSIGSVILSNHPTFRGYNNHIINYVDINGTLYFIEPQTDTIMQRDDVFRLYKYIRLYPDGTQVPSNWKYNLAYDLKCINQ